MAERIDVLSVIERYGTVFLPNSGLDGKDLADAQGVVEDLIEAAHLVAFLASLEWQEPDGKRYGATDNQGRRLFFVSPDLIHDLREVLSRIEGQP